MLGLLLIYWIGKYYYRLAGRYKRNEMGYAVLGVVAYYAGGFLLTFLLGIVGELVSPGSLDNINEIFAALMFLAFGLLSCYFIYICLERNWDNKRLAETDLSKHLVE